MKTIKTNEMSLQTTSSVFGTPAFNTPVPASDWALRDYLRAILKRRVLVLSVAAIVTVLTATYMFLQPDTYVAEAEVQVDLENAPNLTASKNTSVIVSNALNDPTYFGTQLQILSGPRLLQRVIKSLDLEHNEQFAPTSNSRWQSMKSLIGIRHRPFNTTKRNSELPISNQVPTTTSREELDEATRLAPLVTEIQQNLETEPVKESRLPNKTTRLIRIGFENPDRVLAAKFVNTLADTYVLDNLESIRNVNEATGQFLQTQITEIQRKIRDGEQRLIDYAKSNQIVSLDSAQNTTVDRLLGLNQQLLQAENDRKVAESAYRASLEPGAAEALAQSNNAQIPGADTTAAAQISKTEGRLAELKEKRAELLVENTEEWPEVKAINEQIKVLEQEVKDARDHATGIVKANLETKYRQALSREEALRSAFEQQRNQSLTQNEAAINYRIIQQEIETNKGLLDSLLQRSKQNDIAIAGTANNIHVLNYAVVPNLPVGPRRAVNTILALLLSVSFGIGLALLLEYIDDSVQSPQIVEEVLGLPTLSLIPSVRGKLRGSILSNGQLTGSSAEHPELIMNSGADSCLAEAYRHLRTSVLMPVTEKAPQTLLITSSQPNEGKTTTALNMAVSLAQTDAAVLLIDADMRRPCLHTMLNLNNEKGLSTFLKAEIGTVRASDLIQTKPSKDFTVLTAGPPAKNPTELLAKPQLAYLLQQMKPHFDFILIDSPPLINFTDSVVISAVSDSVLLVVHGRKTSREIVRCAADTLARVGASISGVIINNVTPAKNDYLYFQRYNSPEYR